MYSDAEEENLERYRTARHEAIHCLAALDHGHKVIRVNIDEAVSLIEFRHFPYEMVRLRQTDPGTAARVVQGVMATCTSPSVYEHESVNPGDAAALAKWRPYWSGTPTWNTISAHADRHIRTWLRDPHTQRQIRQLSEKFYVFRILDGETLARVLAPFSQSPPAPPVAAPPTPSPTITAAQRDLQNLIAFYAVPGSAPAPTPERTLPHADEKHRPNGFYRPRFLVA